MLLRQVGAKLRALKLFKFRIHEHGKKISQLGHGCYILQKYTLSVTFFGTQKLKKNYFVDRIKSKIKNVV